MPEPMRAVVHRRYGPPERVLRVRNVPVPTPRRHEVLVRVEAASLHADIWHMVRGYPRILRVMGGGFWAPRCSIPGTDVAGVVTAIGPDVSAVRPGDPVFGEVVPMQWRNGGTYAEFACVHEKWLYHKPDAVSFVHAAAVPTSGLIAHMNLLDAGRLREGQDVLINGAGGALGALAIPLAKAWGARVTAVDHGTKAGAMKQMGADEVIDYTTADFTALDADYDLVFDVASVHTWRQIERVVRPGGRYVMIGHDHYGSVGRRTWGSIPPMMRLMARGRKDSRISTDFTATDRRRRMGELIQLMEQGKLKPLVSRVFPLEDVVPAMQHLASGAALGKIVLSPSGGDADATN